MELAATFNEFLKDTVNLNATRIANLESSVSAIKSFIKQSTWKPNVLDFWEQGSWAHDTIIKPVDQGEFDADLLVRVEAVEGWTAKDYITELARVFKQSATYKRKTKAWDYCVTITYANDKKIDVAPLVEGRQWAGSLEVCNKRLDRFERSEPKKYTDWLIAQNAISGGNSFRKVTRLLKYLRDIKTRFVCPSVLMTTMLAKHIYDTDKGSDDFKTVPRCLKTLVGRLDNWLQQNETKPKVTNPYLSGADEEDFASGWTDAQYTSFRNSIHRYRGWIDDAYGAVERDASIEAWRKLFGAEFAPGVITETAKAQDGRYALANPLSKAASALGDLIDALKVFGRAAIPKNYAHLPHMQKPAWTVDEEDEVEVVVTATVGGGSKSMNGKPVASGQLLRAGPSIHFEARRPDGQPLGPEYRVEWRITNSCGVPNLRGDFYRSDSGNTRVEPLVYRGVHLSEAFVVRIRDSALVGVSDPFYVAIE
ncbi:SMODS domain-containing nucleotidyltransferase [Caulobacter segnis]